MTRLHVYTHLRWTPFPFYPFSPLSPSYLPQPFPHATSADRSAGPPPPYNVGSMCEYACLTDAQTFPKRCSSLLVNSASDQHCSRGQGSRKKCGMEFPAVSFGCVVRREISDMKYFFKLFCQGLWVGKKEIKTFAGLFNENCRTDVQN